tara:strand:+ start:65200 stop:65571 length:372 start_codon:yes stop_codon:yes gene_type:complete
MKTILFITTMMATSVPVLACISEAQVTRVIKTVKIDPEKKSCKAFIDLSLEAKKGSFFSTFSDEEIKNSKEPLCKLELNEIAKDGVEVGLTEDGHCRKDVGDELDGEVQKTSDSSLILKNLSI